MAKLTKEEVLKLARLARLDLTEDETEEYLIELNSILSYVEQLASVNTEGLKPTNQVTGLVSVMRDDTEIDYGYKARDMLKNVPSLIDDQIKVKRMVE